MSNLLIAGLAVAFAYGGLYFLATHSCRLFGEQVRWFDGDPTITSRIRVAGVSSTLTFLVSFVLVFVGFFALPHVQPTRRVMVRPDSAAEQAGIRTGDEITRIDSRPIVSFEDIKSGVLASDGHLRVELRRGSEMHQIEATLTNDRLGVESMMVEKTRAPSEAFTSAWTMFGGTFSTLLAAERGSAKLMGPVAIVRETASEKGGKAYVILMLVLLSGSWLMVPMMHIFDLATLAMYRLRRTRTPHSRDVFNLLALGVLILVLFVGGVVAEMPQGASSVGPLFEFVTKTCGLSLSLASFTALKRHLSLHRAGALALVGSFVGPILWVGTFAWIRRRFDASTSGVTRMTR